MSHFITLPEKNILKIFLDTGNYWVTLRYTIFFSKTGINLFFTSPLSVFTDCAMDLSFCCVMLGN